MVGAQGKHIKGPEIPASLTHLAEEQHLVGDVQLMRQVFEVLLQAPAAEDRQAAFGRQCGSARAKPLSSVAWSLSGCRRPTLPTTHSPGDNPSASRASCTGTWLACMASTSIRLYKVWIRTVGHAGRQRRMSSRTASDTPSRLRRLRKIPANSLRLRRW